MNWLALEDLPEFSAGPRTTDSTARLHAIRDAGYGGVQFIAPLTAEQDRAAADLNLWRCSSGRVNHPSDVKELVDRCRGEGQNCATLHVGWGIEEDNEAHALIEAILEASAPSLPLYVETHRATLFQDMWRTVQFIRRYPDLRFNGDFSHWYTGQEMVYGGFENKLAFIRPVIERVRFIHGRIGNPGCIQVALPRPGEPEPLYVSHFRTLWSASFEAFQQQAETNVIPFVPELLSPSIYYGRHGESDRWTDSLQMLMIARDCFPI